MLKVYKKSEGVKPIRPPGRMATPRGGERAAPGEPGEQVSPEKGQMTRWSKSDKRSPTGDPEEDQQQMLTLPI